MVRRAVLAALASQLRLRVIPQADFPIGGPAGAVDVNIKIAVKMKR